MIDTIIVSGGDIQCDFALDFLKKYTEKCREENIRLIAADRGLEFFLDCRIMPDVVIGDFDSLSEDGKEFPQTFSFFLLFFFQIYCIIVDK